MRSKSNLCWRDRNIEREREREKGTDRQNRIKRDRERRSSSLVMKKESGNGEPNGKSIGSHDDAGRLWECAKCGTVDNYSIGQTEGARSNRSNDSRNDSSGKIEGSFFFFCYFCLLAYCAPS